MIYQRYPSSSLFSTSATSTFKSHFATLPVCTTSTLSSPPSPPSPDGSVSTYDLTREIIDAVAESKVMHGTVVITTPHTTVGLCVNEYEQGLDADLSKYLLNLAPIDSRHPIPSRRNPGVTYDHNNISDRPSLDPAWIGETERCLENGWNVKDPETLQKWRDQEPVNANAHLISILVGTSVTLSVVDAKLVLGEWQSILMLEADGPRNRKVNVHITGI
eukprot:CAMPEP_0118638568 /NCGR_PEP_ID=MMETSP0785-20121206/3759_1 /TAXON_ID=91992 /ORGANISM="Bolidomonas pacifica, Strain CCMP 1866" /LENGTH=217 /DNA_ID=CAMNT_0006529837 /DNA_START=195 /DNA_END=848 /DNA_ORIENTATION=-